MILKPQTWRRPSLAPTVTVGASILSATLGVLLVLTHDYRTTPPIIVVAATAAALAWIWRMLLARAVADYRADEELIQAVRRQRPDDEARLREEAAFREITRYFNEEA